MRKEQKRRVQSRVCVSAVWGTIERAVSVFCGSTMRERTIRGASAITAVTERTCPLGRPEDTLSRQ